MEAIMPHDYRYQIFARATAQLASDPVAISRMDALGRAFGRVTAQRADHPLIMARMAAPTTPQRHEVNADRQPPSAEVISLDHVRRVRNSASEDGAR
jgi:hypothetical protein